MSAAVAGGVQRAATGREGGEAMKNRREGIARWLCMNVAVWGFALAGRLSAGDGGATMFIVASVSAVLLIYADEWGRP